MVVRQRGSTQRADLRRGLPLSYLAPGSRWAGELAIQAYIDMYVALNSAGTTAFTRQAARCIVSTSTLKRSADSILRSSPRQARNVSAKAAQDMHPPTHLVCLVRCTGCGCMSWAHAARCGQSGTYAYEILRRRRGRFMTSMSRDLQRRASWETVRPAHVTACPGNPVHATYSEPLCVQAPSVTG